MIPRMDSVSGGCYVRSVDLALYKVLYELYVAAKRAPTDRENKLC